MSPKQTRGSHAAHRARTSHDDAAEQSEQVDVAPLAGARESGTLSSEMQEQEDIAAKDAAASKDKSRTSGGSALASVIHVRGRSQQERQEMFDRIASDTGGSESVTAVGSTNATGGVRRDSDDES